LTPTFISRPSLRHAVYAPLLHFGFESARINKMASLFKLKSDEFSSVFLRPLPFGDGRRPIVL
jgi:hypothetical protein